MVIVQVLTMRIVFLVLVAFMGGVRAVAGVTSV